jgi:hypothetical protein
VNKITEEFKQRYGGNDPSEMTLQQISQAAQEMLKKLEGSQGNNDRYGLDHPLP